MRITRNFSPLSINIETEEELAIIRRILMKFDDYDNRENARFLCYSPKNPPSSETILTRRLLEGLK